MGPSEDLETLADKTEAELLGFGGAVPISATSGLPMKQHDTTC
jgi:hypothetical protein